MNSQVIKKRDKNLKGFPNVGKSSLLNSLNGRKVVSVSRTPGHTKHLQTVFLTKNVRLCDCPGLVFPSLVSKPLQILAGIYPIAQLQEPYSAIRYLAERIPVIEILKLKHPAETSIHEKENEWSPLDLCEGWAIKRGYFTAKASRPDVYRAANELLRMALDGRLCLGLRPVNFHKEKQLWKEHPETKQLDGVIKNVEHIAKEKRTFKAETNVQYEDQDDSDEEEEEEFGFETNETNNLESSDDDDNNDDTFGEKEFNRQENKNPYSLLKENE